ncbi:MAG: hypothetical protein JWM27_2211 [Gemmatimonadetes bacterium]|nr:hypothetical protein [Gemmatimonadota bacterium]
MTRASIERLLWAVALAGSAAAWAGTRGAAPPHRRAHPSPLTPPPAVREIDPALLADARRRIEEGDPFRLARRPAAAPFVRQVAGLTPGPGMPGGVFVPPPPPRFRPPLALTGIVGPPWQALLEGVPNQQGALVVREGERYGDLRIRTVRPDHVVVQGPDTTWRLTLKPKWQ